MFKRRTYSEETKAGVMSALLQGQSTYSISRECDIPIGTIKSWKNRSRSTKTLKLTKRIKDKIVRLHKAGLGKRDILTQLDIDEATLIKWLGIGKHLSRGLHYMLYINTKGLPNG